MFKKDDFLKTSKNEIDKILEKTELYNRAELQAIKHKWKCIFMHLYTWLVILILIIVFICFGYYYDWSVKTMIEKAFGYLLTAIITGLIEYFIIENLQRKNHAN